MSELTYTPVGRTRTGDLPSGFNHLHHRLLLGSGADLYRHAGEAVVTFAMHRATGARVTTEAARADPGVHLAVGVGPLRAPCEVIWQENGPRRTGFGYGTRAGHPASGEEAFLVEHHANDEVWFRVVAYSRPAGALMLLAGPAAVFAQRLYARRCGQALKRLCTVKR